MIQVRNGPRIMQFEGRLIAMSSSWRRGSHRWVEFRLYKLAESGNYVLSRTGVSTLYHHPQCPVVDRNKLREEPRSELKADSVPCDQCRPDRDNFPLICPERDRNWAQECVKPEAVIQSLMKEDDSGALYLTFVAQRLLEEAAEVDDGICEAYSIETLR